MIKLLIVCRGNTCRSPMAEYILRNMLEKTGQSDFHVVSAGTHKGSILTASVHEILTAHGIKHDSKRPAQSIDDLQLNEFDQILVMDNGVKNDVLAKIADADVRAKVKLFLDDAEVSDPYGQDKTIYEETYQIIHRGCVSIIEGTTT